MKKLNKFNKSLGMKAGVFLTIIISLVCFVKRVESLSSEEFDSQNRQEKPYKSEKQNSFSNFFSEMYDKYIGKEYAKYYQGFQILVEQFYKVAFTDYKLKYQQDTLRKMDSQMKPIRHMKEEGEERNEKDFML